MYQGSIRFVAVDGKGRRIPFCGDTEYWYIIATTPTKRGMPYVIMPIKSSGPHTPAQRFENALRSLEYKIAEL